MECVTVNLTAYTGQPNIEICAAKNLDSSLEWLADYFEAEACSGARFQSNETVQVGWMVTLLKEAKGDALEIWEPNFLSTPVEWTRGVNNTINHYLLQKEVCDVVGSVPDFPSLSQSAIVSSDFAVAKRPYMMTREPQLGNDSGWLFLDLEYEEGPTELRSLYEIAVAQPSVIPFLACPPGTTAEISINVLELIFDGQIWTSKSNELLERVSKSKNYSYL